MGDLIQLFATPREPLKARDDSPRADGLTRFHELLGFVFSECELASAAMVARGEPPLKLPASRT
jgi:hypothetical protein